MSMFGHITEAPIDPILGTTQLYNADTNAKKINLGVGAYRTEEGKPFVLDVVRKAEAEILNELGTKNNKEYAAIDGTPELKTVTQKLIFGETSPAIAEGRIATVQALSGTGALRVAAEFCKIHMPKTSQEIWVSDPTWGNHKTVFKEGGLKVVDYPYWDEKTKSLNFAGMLAALKKAPAGALILLHACAHNPTGIDPTEAQWKEIATVMKAQKLVPVMDSAYQGYASGSLEKDRFAVKYFLEQGFPMIVCQSFAKNLGLYGERIGALHVVCANKKEQVSVTSQLKLVIRAMYSSPPIHGAHLVVKILGNEKLYTEWTKELKGMADRILEVRSLLRKGLEAKGTPGTWNHITDQIGMFSYTGLTEPQCERLIKEHHIYLLKSGRISMAGLNRSNVGYFADCVDEVIRYTAANPSSKL
eukprot:gnl/TRDRNA2_/TRDRNA2_182223_c0_seq1.p1 gnl/TRDRNA2_/TRDRNA2_182223_c0~~gnl/TRDRNA2_/TRDRNA2_182223_c0_seq1.p1  ORF type:complete len:416 (-),score=106.49 gnl/TRDRNA2_/TRDRNA2_182223_c0_seq1:81-1328(-)